MALKRKKIKSKSQPNPQELTGQRGHHLCYGFIPVIDPSWEVPDDSARPGFPFQSEDHRKELYFKFRDHLFEFDYDGMGSEDVAAVPRKPGTKPRAYFDYEATQAEIEKGNEL